MQAPINILLVDDEADFRKLMMFWLKGQGYSVVEAANGNEAVRIVKGKRPDLVFLDFKMPGMNGVETLQEIRKIDKKVPVIIISAHLDDPMTGGISQEGVSGIFCKDENFETALPLLKVALRAHKELKRRRRE